MNNNNNNNLKNIQPLIMANENNQAVANNTISLSNLSDCARILENAVKREESQQIADNGNNAMIYDLTEDDVYDGQPRKEALRDLRVAARNEPDLEDSRGLYRGGRYMGAGGVDVGSNSFYSQRSEEFYIAQKLRNIGGPTLELEPIEKGEEQKFSVRNRIYVGNLSSDVTKNEDLIAMFKPYGEITDVFLNTEKNFAFVKVDWHANAEKAKRALDGSNVKGRQLRVRFASGTAILRVGNLSIFVSNELLYKAFEIFGPVERAVIKVNDRGKHLGEGVVEFSKKSSASNCLRLCHNRCYLLTASIGPCLVEPVEHKDADGMPEKAYTKNSLYFQERSVGPRFAIPGSVDHEYGNRWKNLHALYNSKQDALKREFKMEEKKLEAHLEFMRSERETEYLREELKQREANNECIRLQMEMRQKQFQEIDMFRQNESYPRYQNEMPNVMIPNELPFRRNPLAMPHFMPDQRNIFGAGGNRQYEDSTPFVVFPDKVNHSIESNLINVPIGLKQSGNFIDNNMQDVGNPVNEKIIMERRSYD